MIYRLFGRWRRRKRSARPTTFIGLESLEARRLLAVTANFNALTGILTVSSDAEDPIIIAPVLGTVLVNGANPGAVVPAATVRGIRVTGGPGANVISLAAVTPVDFTGLDSGIIIQGGLGEDVIFGSAFGDSISAGDGNDVVLAGAGDDTVTGGTGHDWLDGGVGMDRFVEVMTVATVVPPPGLLFLIVALVPWQLFPPGTVSPNMIPWEQIPPDFPPSVTLPFGTLTSVSFNGNGQDTLNGFEQASITGTAGNDAITAQAFAGVATLDGAGGNDSLTGTINNDMLIGGAGTDRLVETLLVPGSSTLTNGSYNGNGADILVSIEQASIVATAGDDTLNAAAFSGPMTVDGGAGNDRLIGGFGHDFIDGQVGDDTLTGGPGNDTLVGGLGFDRLIEQVRGSAFGGLSNISYATGDGTDTLSALDEASITGTAASDRIVVTDFNGPVTLIGLDGNDTLVGGLFSDLLLGGTGNDSLSGRDGNDTFIAASGNDTLDGGPGIDLMIEPLAFTGSAVLNDTLYTGNGTDKLVSIERASITGTAGNDTINAANYSGNATMIGGLGNDVLIGGSGSDSISGNEGDDSITGNAGDDTLDGGAGADDRFIETMPEPAEALLTDLLFTGDGTDSLAGFERASINGSAGDDSVDATLFSGVVTLIGNAGNDTLSGTAGDDSFNGGAGHDSITTGAGNNTVTGGPGSDTLTAGAGIDWLIESLVATSATLSDTSYINGGDSDILAGFELVSLTGTTGNDTINAAAFTGMLRVDAGAGNDSVTGGSGDDVILGNLGNNTVSGGDGHDTILGGVNVDKFEGGGGNDFLSAGVGNDTLMGNDGDDTLLGGLDHDSLDGGDGSDSLDGADGNDTLTGGGGDDVVAGGLGVNQFVDLIAAAVANARLTNTLYQGNGNDTISGIHQVRITGNALNNLIDASAFTGSTTLVGGEGDDTLLGGTGADCLDGGNGNDSLRGGGGNDTLIGGGGNDTLWGEGGNDSLVAGDGNDSLVGGDGTDTLNDGAGNDTVLQ